MTKWNKKIDKLRKYNYWSKCFKLSNWLSVLVVYGGDTHIQNISETQKVQVTKCLPIWKRELIRLAKNDGRSLKVAVGIWVSNWNIIIIIIEYDEYNMSPRAEVWKNRSLVA